MLLAVIASMYAGLSRPRGLRAIAERVHRLTSHLPTACDKLGFKSSPEFFDTIRVEFEREDAVEIVERAAKARIQLCVRSSDDAVGISPR